MADAGQGGSGGQRNVLGGVLETCSLNPRTGFYRTGCCDTGPEDVGRHTVCMQATAEFLEYSKSVGNDLSTPAPEHGFAGLKPGDRWCLCASRWAQAYRAGRAPRVYLTATNEATLELVPLDLLVEYAADAS